ncbi:MAG: arginase family protein [Nanoarchaeota archaeon]
MKILAIPNWNGHLYLQEYNDKSILTLYNKIKFKNKSIIKTIKNDISQTNKIIFKEFLNHYKQNNFILTIAGDHSNTYPIINAIQKEGKEFNLIIFDAHPDVEKDNGIPSHEDYLRCLIKNKKIIPKNIYIFGIRTFSRIEFEYLEKNNIKYFTITDILKDINSIKKILENIKGKNYLSIDIDVLDPKYAPGTYYKEHCGLKIEELLELIKIILPKTISTDIVEYYLENDDKNQTTLKNILKIINFIIKNKQ